MNTCVYDKTDKGREEIATRKYHVPPRLRTLLVMIDGRLPLDSLLKNFAGLGVTQASVDELLNQEYIALVSGSADAPGKPAALPPSPSPAAAPEPALRVAASAAPAGDAAAVPVPVDDAERFRHLYDFYNQTIKSTIGLRGIMLQLKVEKCASVDDFRELRLPYLEAVLKAKGSEMAHSMRGRLDHLLGGKPERDDFILPGD